VVCPRRASRTASARRASRRLGLCSTLPRAASARRASRPQAIGIAIQNKAARTTVVDSLAGKFEGPPKTKSVVSMLSGLGLDAAEQTVVVYDAVDETFEKAASNLPNCELRLQDEITVSDMLWANQVLFTQPAFDWVNDKYGEK